MENNTNTLALSNKVSNFKVIARNALRMNLISPRLSHISELEAQVKYNKDSIDKFNHQINVINYEISKLDVNHPNYTKTKERMEAEMKDEYTPMIENRNKAILDLEKEIANQKLGITKIETGETKVCLEELNDLVEKLVIEDAKNQVKA